MNTASLFFNSSSAEQACTACRLKHAFCFFVLMLLVACGDGASFKPLSERSVILAFGDSLTYGSGASFKSSYPVVLEELTGIRVINAGVPGEVTAEGLRRLPNLLEQHQPNLVVLIHGGNDMLRRMSRDAAASNLEAMIALIREAGAEVVIVGVPQPGLILSTAAFYGEVAEKTNTPIEKDVITDILQYRANKADVVHPNAKGYRMLTEAVRQQLVEVGALKD